jgi:hypothetical protein
MEIFHINGGGPGYFSAGVVVPNDVLQPNSLVEIQEINISSVPIREVIEYSIYNTADNILLDGK